MELNKLFLCEDAEEQRSQLTLSEDFDDDDIPMEDEGNDWERLMNGEFDETEEQEAEDTFSDSHANVSNPISASDKYFKTVSLSNFTQDVLAIVDASKLVKPYRGRNGVMRKARLQYGDEQRVRLSKICEVVKEVVDKTMESLNKLSNGSKNDEEILKKWNLTDYMNPEGFKSGIYTCRVGDAGKTLSGYKDTASKHVPQGWVALRLPTIDVCMYLAPQWGPLKDDNGNPDKNGIMPDHEFIMVGDGTRSKEVAAYESVDAFKKNFQYLFNQTIVKPGVTFLTRDELISDIQHLAIDQVNEDAEIEFDPQYSVAHLKDEDRMQLASDFEFDEKKIEEILNKYNDENKQNLPIMDYGNVENPDVWVLYGNAEGNNGFERAKMLFKLYYLNELKREVLPKFNEALIKCSTAKELTEKYKQENKMKIKKRVMTENKPRRTVDADLLALDMLKDECLHEEVEEETPAVDDNKNPVATALRAMVTSYLSAMGFDATVDCEDDELKVNWKKEEELEEGLFDKFDRHFVIFGRADEGDAFGDFVDAADSTKEFRTKDQAVASAKVYTKRLTDENKKGFVCVAEEVDAKKGADSGNAGTRVVALFETEPNLFTKFGADMVNPERYDELVAEFNIPNPAEEGKFDKIL